MTDNNKKNEYKKKCHRIGIEESIAELKRAIAVYQQLLDSRDPQNGRDCYWTERAAANRARLDLAKSLKRSMSKIYFGSHWDDKYPDEL